MNRDNKLMDIDKKELQEYYEGTGCSTDDTIKHLRRMDNYNGFDVSFDESLYVFNYPQLIIIIGVGGLQFVDKAPDPQAEDAEPKPYVIYSTETLKVVYTTQWYGKADQYVQTSVHELRIVNRTHPVNKEILGMLDFGEWK